MSKVFCTMVANSTVVSAVRQLAHAMPASMGMFMASYSPTGSKPATHFVSEGWIEEEFANAMGNPASLVDIVLSAGVALSIEEASFILANSVVSTRPAAELLQELGVVPVQEEAV